MTYAQSIRETLRNVLTDNSRVILMGEDIGEYGGAFRITEGFIHEFGPDRIIETPISEGSVTGAAVGASLRGLIPIVEIMFMDFITLCLDQILNHGAKFPAMFGPQAEVPVVIRTPAGGGRGYGPTHSQSLESLLLPVPGISIAVPSTPQDASSLLKRSVETPEITIFIEGKTLYSVKGEVDLDLDPIEFGRSRTVRQGNDVTVTAFGRMVPEALKAADVLQEKDISCEVIDLRTLKPLDAESISGSVEKTGRLVTVEESPLTGGTGAEIASRIFEQAYFYLDAPVKRVASADGPVPASIPLEQKHIPDAHRIAQTVFSLFTDR